MLHLPPKIPRQLAHRQKREKERATARLFLDGKVFNAFKSLLYAQFLLVKHLGKCSFPTITSSQPDLNFTQKKENRPCTKISINKILFEKPIAQDEQSSTQNGITYLAEAICTSGFNDEFRERQTKNSRQPHENPDQRRQTNGERTILLPQMPKGTSSNSSRRQNQESICPMQMRARMDINLCTGLSTHRLLQQIPRRLEKTKLRHNQTKIAQNQRTRYYVLKTNYL